MDPHFAKLYGPVGIADWRLAKSLLKGRPIEQFLWKMLVVNLHLNWQH